MVATSIVLIGPMGSGKSTVGRALAERVSLKHLDLDEMVEASCGMTIPEIFALDGELRFRALEHTMLHRALSGGAAVISTGGGVVTAASNRDLLACSRALVVWLDASVETLTLRLGNGTTRPLLAGNDVEAALRAVVAQRDAWYFEVADIPIYNSDTTVEGCVDLIVALVAPDSPKPVRRRVECP